MRYEVLIFFLPDLPEYISVRYSDGKEFDSSFDELVFDYLSVMSRFAQEETSITGAWVSFLDRHDETRFQVAFESEQEFPEDLFLSKNTAFFQEKESLFNKYSVVQNQKLITSKPERTWIKLSDLDLETKHDFIG